MELILIRHADAASGAVFAEDAMRPLTEKGVQTQKRVAAALKSMGMSPDTVLASPRERAQQTAWLTADALDRDVETLDVLDGGHRLSALCEALSDYDADSTVMCVGHEPDMSSWASSLLCKTPSYFVKFKKSAVMGIGFSGHPQPGRGQLLYFYRAADLKSLV
ncbi:MAG TPA: phosphohistidine phosphatase SixA [Gammaproteobacteria bacterium]|nr:phosphohistidine phosphatase SixA [Gammaproteobacteria bacterium]